MIIHKSFSKSELINIIEKYKIDIENPSQYRKVELSAILVQKIDCLDEITPIPDLPFLNLIELKCYLTNINPKKTLSIKQKNDIVTICKKIKHFCENDFDIESSVFRDENDLQEQLQKIKSHGTIPSVRLAIKRYNRRPDLTDTLSVDIPEYVQRELEYRDKLRENREQQQLQVKKGKFILTF